MEESVCVATIRNQKSAVAMMAAARATAKTKWTNGLHTRLETGMIQLVEQRASIDAVKPSKREKVWFDQDEEVSKSLSQAIGTKTKDSDQEHYHD